MSASPVPQSHQETKLDEALRNSFPASDPLSCTPRLAGKGDHKVDPETAVVRGRWRQILERITKRPH